MIYKFESFVAYQINWPELDNIPVKVITIRNEQRDEQVMKWGEVAKNIYETREKWKLEYSALSDWYLRVDDNKVSYRSEIGSNPISLLKLYTELLKDNIHLDECSIFYFTSDGCKQDPITSFKFFIQHKDTILDSFLYLHHSPTEHMPQSAFKVEEDHVWDLHQKLQHASSLLAYEKFYRTKYLGRLLDRSEKSQLEENLFGSTINTYGETLERKDLLTLSGLEKILKQTKPINWLLAVIAIELFLILLKI